MPDAPVSFEIDIFEMPMPEMPNYPPMPELDFSSLPKRPEFPPPPSFKDLFVYH